MPPVGRPFQRFEEERQLFLEALAIGGGGQFQSPETTSDTYLPVMYVTIATLRSTPLPFFLWQNALLQEFIKKLRAEGSYGAGLGFPFFNLAHFGDLLHDKLLPKVLREPPRVDHLESNRYSRIFLRLNAM